MTEQQAAPSPARRTAQTEIACAIDLGWRMAELFGLDPGELIHSAADNLLPGRTSLPPSERLALELRAAAGDAQRAGVPIGSQELSELLGLAAEAPEHPAKAQELRERIKACHIRLDTALWAKHEAKGRAYELGNFLSDTWNRTVRALRAEEEPVLARELRSVFCPERIDRIKVQLDELEARLDPAAVRIVRRQLETWRDRVAAQIGEDGRSLPFELEFAALRPLHDQAVTWRQLVSGSKEPEAYIDREHRGKVGAVMVKRIVDGYRRHAGAWIGVLIVALTVSAIVLLLSGPLASWYDHHKALTSALVGFVGTIAAALGVSSASVGATVRKSLDHRADLMWNAALAEVICEQTLFVDRLLPEPRRTRSERVRMALRMEARKAARRVEPEPPLMPQH